MYGKCWKKSLNNFKLNDPIFFMLKDHWSNVEGGSWRVKWDLLILCSAGNWDFHVFYHWEWDFLNATENGKKNSRLRLGFQDMLLMGMGYRNKQRWENGIWPHPPPPPPHPLPSGSCAKVKFKQSPIFPNILSTSHITLHRWVNIKAMFQAGCLVY